MRHLLAGLALATTLAGCGGASDTAAPTQSQTVSASAGATLTLPSGARLEIPPGALPADTDLTFRELGDADERYYEVQPALQLSLPATLRLPFAIPPEAIGQENSLRVFDSSSFNPLENRGSELEQWEPVVVTGVDPEHRTLTLQTTHFSGWGLVWSVDEAAYLVVAIPDSTVEPANMPMIMSGDAWNPGHASLYVADGDIVESVPGSGVTSSRLERRGADNVYLGARTPKPSFNLTPEERQKVVSAGLTLRGRPYNLVGSADQFLATLTSTLTTSGIFTANGLSCVGFLDAAYQDALQRTPFRDDGPLVLTPWGVYKATLPQRSITVKANAPLALPVYGLVVDPSSGYSDLFGQVDITDSRYTRQRTSTSGGATSTYSIGAEGVPAGAVFRENPDGYVLEWTPPTPQEVTVTFTMHPRSQATGSDGPVTVPGGERVLRQELTLRVIP